MRDFRPAWPHQTAKLSTQQVDNQGDRTQKHRLSQARNAPAMTGMAAAFLANSAYTSTI